MRIEPPAISTIFRGGSLLRLAADDDGSDETGGHADQSRGRSEQEDLPYKVELWDDDKRSAIQVLAVTANAAIGYAAYFAATQEHPGRYITLRDKNGIVSRWNGPAH